MGDVLAVLIVELVETLHPDTIALGDAVHGIAHPHYVLHMLGGGASMLFLQIDHVALFEWEVHGGIVVFGQLGGSHVELFGQRVESVALLGYDVEQPVAEVSFVLESALLLFGGLVVLFVGCGIRLVEPGGVLLTIQSIKLIYFHHLDQQIGIAPIGGIATALESRSPTSVVFPVEFEQGAIAWLEQEFGMIFVRFASGRVAAEAFVRGIVGTIGALARPGFVAFDAEVIVVYAGQRAGPGAGLHQSLRDGDAGRYIVTAHLPDGLIGILLHVSLVCAVSALSQPDGCPEEKENRNE